MEGLEAASLSAHREDFLRSIRGRPGAFPSSDPVPGLEGLSFCSALRLAVESDSPCWPVVADVDVTESDE
jgi:hypothetical protein